MVIKKSSMKTMKTNQDNKQEVKRSDKHTNSTRSEKQEVQQGKIQTQEKLKSNNEEDKNSTITRWTMITRGKNLKQEQVQIIWRLKLIERMINKKEQPSDKLLKRRKMLEEHSKDS